VVDIRSGVTIAARPARVRGVSDLLRLLPYLKPYRERWIAMIVIALVSLSAAVVIPLMTKAVIDGPVRHRDSHGLWVLGSAAIAVGITEAVLWFIRRWLVSRATMGVEADIRKDLYARLQILPMSFHGRWQSGQLLSRMMNDLNTIRRLLAFGLVFLMLNILQIVVVTAILLAMYWERLARGWFIAVLLVSAIALTLLARIGWVMHNMDIGSGLEVSITLLCAALGLAACLGATASNSLPKRLSTSDNCWPWPTRFGCLRLTCKTNTPTSTPCWSLPSPAPSPRKPSTTARCWCVTTARLRTPPSSSGCCPSCKRC
jgi:ABC-type multidrug transport system fused ATPase/permease subunit